MLYKYVYQPRIQFKQPWRSDGGLLQRARDGFAVAFVGFLIKCVDMLEDNWDKDDLVITKIDLHSSEIQREYCFVKHETSADVKGGDIWLVNS